MSKGLPKNPEQRHYKRIDMELAVKLEIDGQIIKSTTENISCGGMFVPVPESQFSSEDEFTATITMPEGHKDVKLKAKVCRIQKNEGSESDGLAVQFSGLYDDNRMELDRLIKWNLLN